MNEVSPRGTQRTNHLLCVTIPRSGHHFLQNILTQYFGKTIHYCFRVDAGNCCNQVPCARSDNRLTLQKSHDPRLAIPTDHENAAYIVQYREPVGQILSYIEMLAGKRKDKPMAVDDPAFLEWWAARHAVTIVDFLRKWIEPGKPDALRFEYNALTANPEKHICDIFERLDRPLKIKRLREVLGRVSRFRAQGAHGVAAPKSPFKPRDVTVSRILPITTVQAFDKAVRARTPFMSWRESVIGGEADPAFERLVDIIYALSGRFGAPPASEAVIAAAAESPNPYIQQELKRWEKRARVKLPEAAQAFG